MPRGSGNWQPSPARGTPSLTRAPGRPRSPLRGGRAHSGGRGAGNSVRPARGSSNSNLRAAIPGKKLLKPKEARQSQLPTLGAGPDVLLRQQRLYAGVSTGKGPPTSVCSAPVPPTPAGGAGLPLLDGDLTQQEEATWINRKKGREDRARESPGNFIFSEKEKSKGRGKWIHMHWLTEIENCCLILWNFLLPTSFVPHNLLFMFTVQTVNSFLLWTNFPTLRASSVCPSLSLIET